MSQHPTPVRPTWLVWVLGLTLAGVVSTPSWATDPEFETNEKRNYKLKVAVSAAGVDSTAKEYGIEVYAYESDEGRRFVVQLDDDDPQFPGALRVGAVLVDDEYADVDFESPARSTVTHRVLPLLVPPIPRGHLDGPTSGDQRRRFDDLSLYRKIGIVYETKWKDEKKQETLVYEMKIKEPATATLGSRTYTLEKLKYQFEFDKSGRMTKAQWLKREKKESAAGAKVEETRVRATLASHSQMKPAQMDAIRNEFEAVQEVTHMARSGTTLKALAQAEKKLVNTKAKFKEGALVKAALPALEAQISDRLLQAQIRENPDKLIKKRLLKKPAPELELMDTNDNKVSLESLKGKVVLLNFFGTS